jgi:hypothetical protein
MQASSPFGGEIVLRYKLSISFEYFHMASSSESCSRKWSRSHQQTKQATSFACIGTWQAHAVGWKLNLILLSSHVASQKVLGCAGPL